MFGYDDAPHGHCEIAFENVRVPAKDVLLGEGRGFEIGQGRLGPGRLHHCLRSIGVAERALETMVAARQGSAPRSASRSREQGVIMEWIADSRIEIDQARLLVYDAAEMLDRPATRRRATRSRWRRSSRRTWRCA